MGLDRRQARGRLRQADRPDGFLLREDDSK
jgi:hypothetical protein